MRVLVTGGAGYIGSFTTLQLRNQGHEVIVFDSLENGHRASLPDGISLVEGDLRRPEELEAILSRETIDAVIHFAGYIESGESMVEPLKFFENNLSAGINLLQSLNRHRVSRLIFSSTAGVYGCGEPPYREESPVSLTSYYGYSKYFFEEVLKSWVKAYGNRAIILRYFNAAGASRDGEYGESHKPETHLIPNVIKAALRQTEKVSVYGTDWETKDGTGVRDYIHVEDLARAHVLSLAKLAEPDFKFSLYNVGLGRGYSVKEIIAAVEEVSGSEIKVDYRPRRDGDWAVSFADSSKIQRDLSWQPEYGLRDIVESGYLWHRKHPQGFHDQTSFS